MAQQISPSPGHFANWAALIREVNFGPAPNGINTTSFAPFLLSLHLFSAIHLKLEKSLRKGLILLNFESLKLFAGR